MQGVRDINVKILDFNVQNTMQEEVFDMFKQKSRGFVLLDRQ